MEHCLSLEVYERGGTSLRRAMAVIFGKLYVTAGEITAHELAEMAETLVEADRAGHTYYRRSAMLGGICEGKHRESPLLEEERAFVDRLTGAALLAVALGANRFE